MAFLKCDVAVPAIQCAIVASTLEHRDANLSVMKFLKSLVSCATEKVRVCQGYYFYRRYILFVLDSVISCYDTIL